MKVKICGITTIQDALDACDAGADALGFVFYEKSPRYILPEKALEIVNNIPPFVQAIGLFVEAKNVLSICKQANIAVAQLHFDDAPKHIDGIQTIRVIRAKNKEDIGKYSDEYRLVDSFVESFGGEGKRVNIEWFNDVDISKIILAGGLNPDNISSFIKLGFYGFDVSSGVELAPGKKDKQKMIDFIKVVKS